MKFARALNAGILLLLAAPYLVLGGLGLVFYQAVRRARKARELAADQEADRADSTELA